MYFRAIQNCATEWFYQSGKTYANPFRDVKVDVEVSGPDGRSQRVPAFWAGNQTWCVRYASAQLGHHHLRSLCSDATNDGLHGREDTLQVEKYVGENLLLRHGTLRMSQSRAHLEHRDGTPFFWLGDTWWLGLTKRIQWPGEFRRLVADRKTKGFTLVQMVAGLYPEMEDFDPRGENEAGLPWEPGYDRIRPAYFDMADLRIDYLVQSGIVPCLFGSWGYHLESAGIDTIKRHWRYLVARYGAYPVVWCMAGEALMPHYGGSYTDQDYRHRMKTGWTDVTRYVQKIDPYHHPITIHPVSAHEGCDMVNDPSLLDLNMLQTGHRTTSLQPMVDLTLRALERTPRLPVVNGEPWYEGISGASWQDAQRFALWTSILSGNAGHTYGANGLWQFNPPGDPFVGPNGSWGETSWEDAAQLPGSAQMGLGRKLLNRYPWWQFGAHPEWVSDPATACDPIRSYAAGIPELVRVIYMPSLAYRSPTVWPYYQVTVLNIEPDIAYRGYFYNPRDGKEVVIGPVVPMTGQWQMPRAPTREDWLLVLENSENG